MSRPATIETQIFNTETNHTSSVKLDPTVTVMASAMHFTHSPNDFVLDRYTIRRGIGVGGFGEVYFAVSGAGKEVALKRIQRNLEVELRGVSHCLNLKHPNLVALHDICRDGEDQAWVVMEYVGGPNLRVVLDQAAADRALQGVRTDGVPPPPPGSPSDLAVVPSGLTFREVRRWIEGAAAGVDHLHAAGLVHRDLKPGNLFDDDGIVKVGDYGLSKFISMSHRGGHTESVGTFHYMAPEIGRGQYGRGIDLYAMGVVLFELLTGEVPFDGETPQEIVIKHLTDTPDLTRVPPVFREIVRQCLEKDPARRPPDIATFLAGCPWSAETAAKVSDGNSRASRQSGTAVPVASSLRIGPSGRNAWNTKQHEPMQSAGARAATSASEEPLARAVRNSWSDLRHWWHSLDRSPGAKFFLLCATVIFLLINTHWLIPVVSALAIFYVPYYVLRHMVVQAGQPVSMSPAVPGSRTVHSPAAGFAAGHNAGGVSNETLSSRKIMRRQSRQSLRYALASRTRLARGAEWSTSMVTSFVAASVLLLITSVVGLQDQSFSATGVAPYVWLALVTWVASAGLLAFGKAWETAEAGGLSRRLTAAAWGAVVGIFAYGLASFLLLPMNIGLTDHFDATGLPRSFYTELDAPTPTAFMTHFAMLFGLLRMWKPVDPLRRVRFSMWMVAVAVVGEWAIHQLVPVPQPAGILIAGGIAVISQVSAPWVRDDETFITA